MLYRFGEFGKPYEKWMLLGSPPAQSMGFC